MVGPLDFHDIDDGGVFGQISGAIMEDLGEHFAITGGNDVHLVQGNPGW